MGNMQGVSRELLSVPLVQCKLCILIFSLGLFDFEKSKFPLLNDSLDSTAGLAMLSVWSCNTKM